jgi:putative tricarboxylic transport membrane protein
VFLGILVLHGLQPGPMMLTNNQTEIYGLVWALTASCLLASSVGLLFVRPLAMITLVDSQILVPVVLCIAMVGSYAVNGDIGNVVVTAVFGVLGYLMLRLDYPRLTIVIALVLGSALERNYHQSMIMGDGSWSIFFSRTICLILMACIVALLVSPVLRSLIKRDGTGKRLVPEKSS